MLDFLLKLFSLLIYLAFLAPVLFVIVLTIFIIRKRAWEKEDDEF